MFSLISQIAIFVICAVKKKSRKINLLPAFLFLFCVFCIKKNCLKAVLEVWLRELDLNQRPSGYEPDELPSCSIPRCNFYSELCIYLCSPEYLIIISQLSAFVKAFFKFFSKNFSPLYFVKYRRLTTTLLYGNIFISVRWCFCIGKLDLKGYVLYENKKKFSRFCNIKKG